MSIHFSRQENQASGCTWLLQQVSAPFMMSRMMSVVYHDVEGHTIKIISLLDKARAIDA